MDLDDQPQGGPDVLSWRTPDGVGHRFDDGTYIEYDTSGWQAICDASLENALPDLVYSVDCMACVAKGWL